MHEFVQPPVPYPTVSAPKLSYSIDEAVEATGIGRTSLYEDISAGRLVARKRGNRTVILVAELQAYLAALPVAPPSV